MRTRLLQPASLIAAGAAFVGFVGIVSALTPEAADRFQIVGGVLPPGMPEGARVVALAFGLLLVWLWRSLVRRKHRAWQLAVALVLGSTVAHLAKGLDFEEATSGIVLLVALVRWRHGFFRPGRACRPRTVAADGEPRRRPRRRPLAALPSRTTRLLGAHRGRGPSSSRRSRRARALSLVPAARRPRPCADAGSARRRSRSSPATAGTASPSSRCARTRATSSRRPAARSSPTAS